LEKIVIVVHNKDAPIYVMGVNVDKYTNEDIVSTLDCFTNYAAIALSKGRKGIRKGEGGLCVIAMFTFS